VLWVAYLVAVPFFAWQKVDKVDFEPDGDRPGDQPGTTYLMVGSDSRGDLSPEERKRLGTGNAAGQRTDTIMVLHTGDGPNLLMSIPRDSRVAIPGHGDDEKINAAFAYGGPKLLTETIEDATGIRIDHYVEIGFGGFVDLVDAVGGVEICPEKAIEDKLAKINIDKGCQEVDGVTALGYSRSRHTYAQGDLQRAQAQREVVSAIGHKVASPWSVLNPFRYWDLNMAATKAVAVGEGMGPLRAGMWASAMTHVNGDDGLTCGVPIADLSVRWDEERAQKMFDAIIEDDTDRIEEEKLCTPTGVGK
jgi:LCP family protein required for cell wall assembly